MMSLLCGKISQHTYNSTRTWCDVGNVFGNIEFKFLVKM